MPATPVSVVVPTYNRADLLPRAIESAFAAMSPEDELIIADDGSTDETESVVARYGDRLRFLRCPHAGAGATRNAGIRAATRPLVGFLDSDDEWDADKLTIQRAFMDARPDLLFSFTDFRMIESDSKVQPHFLINWRPDDQRPWEELMGQPVPYSSILPLPTGRGEIQVYIADVYRILLETFLMSAVTLLVRREQAGDALHFGEGIDAYEDHECFARLARAGQGCYLDCDAVTQYGHGGPRITDANTEKKTRGMLTVLGRVWGQDESFLKEHGALFQEKVRQQRLILARWLLCRGRTREAREELRLAGASPASYRMLASLPGFMTKNILRALRSMKTHQTAESN